MPTKSKYGGWPRSGEIDLMEARGNIKFGDKEEMGVEQVAAALHFGPSRDQKGSAVFRRNNSTGFHTNYHIYEFLWDESGIKYLLDGIQYGYVPVGDGFWKRGNFTGDNIWKSGTKMAPFDEEVIFGLLIYQMRLCLDSNLNCILFYGCSSTSSSIWPLVEISSQT